jgi:hypothetical protein
MWPLKKAEPFIGSVPVTVYGDTVEELQTKALDIAREFFGDGPRLEVPTPIKPFMSEGGPNADRGRYGINTRVNAYGELRPRTEGVS